MKKRSFIILTIAVIAIIVGLVTTLTSCNSGKTDNETEATASQTAGATFSVPSETEEPENGGLTDESVVTESEETVTDNGQEESETETQEDSTEKITDGEVINDSVMESQEETEKQDAEKADKENPTVAGDEETVKSDESKPDVTAGEDETDTGTTDDGKSGSAVYVPQSGDHPFEEPVDGGEQGETNVEDLLGEDGLRPGEGIHF